MKSPGDIYANFLRYWISLRLFVSCGTSCLLLAFLNLTTYYIKDIISVPLRRVRTTRSSTHSYPFQVSLPNPQILSHKSSFIPRTCNLWNVLPSSCFPESYNLPSFKNKINNLDLIPLVSQPFAFFFLPLLELYIARPPWPFLNMIYQIQKLTYEKFLPEWRATYHKHKDKYVLRLKCYRLLLSVTHMETFNYKI